MQKTVEVPQLQFSDKALTMSSRSFVGAKMQGPYWRLTVRPLALVSAVVRALTAARTIGWSFWWSRGFLESHWGAATSVQPSGRLTLGHRHVSLRRLSEVCPSWLQLAWFALGIWYIISFTLRIWQSHVAFVLVLLVEKARAAGEGHEMHFTATFWAHLPPLAAGVQHFYFGNDEPPTADSRPDLLSAVSGPQERGSAAHCGADGR